MTGLSKIDALCLSFTSFSAEAQMPSFRPISEATKKVVRKLAPAKPLPDLEASLKNLRAKNLETLKDKQQFDLENRNRFLKLLAGILPLGLAVDYLFAEVLKVSGWKLALALTIPISLMASSYFSVGNRSFTVSFAAVNEVQDRLAELKEFFSERHFKPLIKMLQSKIGATRYHSPEHKTYVTALKELYALSRLCKSA